MYRAYDVGGKMITIVLTDAQVRTGVVSEATEVYSFGIVRNISPC